MSFGYKEDLLQFIWEHQLYNPRNLKTETGESVTILKQGYLNQNSGPDFENAELKIGNNTFYGSVEIHIDSKDWDSHKHNKDSSYNNVVLHVCYNHSKNVCREDGTLLPTLVIGDRISQSSLDKYDALLSNKSFVPCENQINALSSFEQNSWLNRMIISRLEQRCELYQSYLVSSNGNWNEAFYCAIVRAFGMPTNAEAFEELAIKLPLKLIQQHQKSLFQLEALFFGIAGLLKESREDNYYVGLQNEYSFLSKKYGLVTIHTQLKFGRMRPMNLPHVKIAQLASFFYNVPHFISHVLELPGTKDVKKILDFELSDYWSSHYSFEKTSTVRKKSISTAFINHLFINSIVPFVFFYEKNKTDIDSERALEYLESIPSEQNSIVSKWKSLDIECKNAQSSQALLHLYKYYCKPKRCLQCNIGKKLLLR